MRFSERWLREWVDPPVSTQELGAQLTAAGLEVDTIEPVAGDIRGVVVGRVITVRAHPNADRLRVCDVDVGQPDLLTVVCGAANVREGLCAPTARDGAELKGGERVRVTTVRGVDSRGMLCSALELGLADTADGLMELDPDASVGQDLATYLALQDTSIELDLTPNRGDCFSVAGVAREVGVLNRLPVQSLDIDPVAPAVTDLFPIRLEAPAECPHYVGRVIRGIDQRNPTPVWMRERLRRSGLRSLGPVVDVTNYVMLELGQPMHAFDLGTLRGRIRVRHATQGEELELLDGNRLTLRPGTLVIADDEAPVALAGIMGGLPTAVTEKTRDVFLESAHFTPRTLAGEARAYALHTDSSHRFERGVDPELQRRAIERATKLLVAIVGGKPGPVSEECAPAELPRHAPIRLRPARIRRILGIDVAAETVSEVLERLGMAVVRQGEEWLVTPPRFRFDIAIEADLIEEIARVVGYQEIPPHRPNLPLAVVGQSEEAIPAARMRQLLVERGYQEAITYSFVEPQMEALLGEQTGAIPLSNPISLDMSVMRTSLWPGLLRVVLHNVNRQQERVRVFESGLVFGRLDGEVLQRSAIAGVVTGPVTPEQWGAPKRPPDFFDLKADVEALLSLTGKSAEYRFVPINHPALHPGQAAGIECGGTQVGLLGALHPRAARELKLTQAAYLFQLQSDAIDSRIIPQFRALSKFPAVRRDLALVVDESVPTQAILDWVGQGGGDVLKDLELFDVYCGESVDYGKKSVALGLTFQASSRTLNDAEVDGLLEQLVISLARELGATLRR